MPRERERQRAKKRDPYYRRTRVIKKLNCTPGYFMKLCAILYILLDVQYYPLILPVWPKNKITRQNDEECARSRKRD